MRAVACAVARVVASASARVSYAEVEHSDDGEESDDMIVITGGDDVDEARKGHVNRAHDRAVARVTHPHAHAALRPRAPRQLQSHGRAWTCPRRWHR